MLQDIEDLRTAMENRTEYAVETAPLMDAAFLLDQLDIMRRTINQEKENRTRDLNSMIPDDVRQRMNNLAAHYDENIAALQVGIDQVEAQIKDIVLENGATIRGNYLMATWNKGRETWDAALLKGFAIAHPEIKAALKVGAPTVSFREVKQADRKAEAVELPY